MYSLILVIVLILQLFPLAFENSSIDLHWIAWNVSMLSIVVLQAFYIYVTTTFEKKPTKIIALLLLAISVFFLGEYIINDHMWVE